MATLRWSPERCLDSWLNGELQRLFDESLLAREESHGTVD
jgi:hypothetical protein